MSEVEALQERILQLSPEELQRLRTWFAEFDAGMWDAQIEADANAGMFDSLEEEALAEYRAAQTHEL